MNYYIEHPRTKYLQKIAEFREKHFYLYKEERKFIKDVNYSFSGGTPKRAASDTLSSRIGLRNEAEYLALVLTDFRCIYSGESLIDHYNEDGIPVLRKDIHHDHVIIPASQGGLYVPGNVLIVKADENLMKGDKCVRELLMYKLKSGTNPYFKTDEEIGSFLNFLDETYDFFVPEFAQLIDPEVQKDEKAFYALFHQADPFYNVYSSYTSRPRAELLDINKTLPVYELNGRNLTATAEIIGESTTILRSHFNLHNIDTSRGPTLAELLDGDEAEKVYIETGGNLTKTAERMNSSVPVVKQKLNSRGVDTTRKTFADTVNIDYVVKRLRANDNNVTKTAIEFETTPFTLSNYLKIFNIDTTRPTIADRINLEEAVAVYNANGRNLTKTAEHFNVSLFSMKNFFDKHGVDTTKYPTWTGSASSHVFEKACEYVESKYAEATSANLKPYISGIAREFIERYGEDARFEELTGDEVKEFAINILKTKADSNSAYSKTKAALDVIVTALGVIIQEGLPTYGQIKELD